MRISSYLYHLNKILRRLLAITTIFLEESKCTEKEDLDTDTEKDAMEEGDTGDGE